MVTSSNVRNVASRAIDRPKESLHSSGMLSKFVRLPVRISEYYSLPPHFRRAIAGCLQQIDLSIDPCHCLLCVHIMANTNSRRIDLASRIALFLLLTMILIGGLFFLLR